MIVGEWAKDPQSERPDSYASAHPNTQDLYLRETFNINHDGSLAFVNGEPVQRGLALLISWSEVAYAEFEEL